MISFFFILLLFTSNSLFLLKKNKNDKFFFTFLINPILYLSFPFILKYFEIIKIDLRNKLEG